MTKIALSPNAAGSGTFTIAAPNSNNNRTITLPDADVVLAPPAELTQTQAEDPASTAFGTVSGQRLAQAFAAGLSGRFFAETRTVAANSNYTFNIGFTPKLVTIYYVCATAAGGYSVGDLVDTSGYQSSTDSSTVNGFAAAIRGTDLLVRTTAIVRLNALNVSSTFTSVFGDSGFNLRVEAFA